MAKTLEFTTKSPRQIKQGDTETTFTFICKNDGSVVDLTKATSITAKIGNASGYLRSQSIATTSLAGLNPGWFNLQPTPTLISGLPAGDYQLEIWVIDQAGTSIYPSDKPLGFTITNNIESESGASITTIAFDDFVEAMNKAASTIDKGDKGDDGLSAYQVAVINGYHGSQTDWLASLKGDTGTVDNAGLISAPAFQSLQAQVNNSAVGTNLLTGTKGWQGEWSNLPLWGLKEEKYEGFDVREHSSAWSSLGKYYDANPNTTYAFSFYAKTSEAGNIMDIYTLDKEDYNSPVVGVPVYAGQPVTTEWQRYSATFTTKSGGKIYPSVCSNKDGIKIDVAGYKLEKGSVATDWCPNPAEILTQSDYAKIKAAIVALGGSLS
ncbi:collagen-like protein [Lactiplantibacillus plantarum]|uniref:collagen-like protein n=1 Tax=Lactiplantibacillus plantarum TaxID=1590 RepID=UPI003D692460